MAELSKLDFEGKFNNSTTGLFKNNTNRDIGADDVRTLTEDITDSFFNKTDDAYTATKGNRAGITAPASLKDIVTVGMPFGVQIQFTDSTASNVVRIYELTNETTAESSPTVIRPNDYAGTTNEKVWRLRATIDVDSDVSGGAVDSVNGQTGVVVLDAGDIANTPAGGIAATTVQAAIDELDSEKQTAAQVATAISTATVGIQDLFIPAAAMWPRVTGGCALLDQFEIATSLFNIQALAFDQTTQEFAQCQVVFPRKWNIGTITVVPYWTAQAGSGTVQWGISGGAYSNDDALTVALGTAQTSDDTLLATNDLHIGPETSAITLAGTPADADFLAIQISRNPGSDTLSGDALLLGISVRITTDAAKDA
jgi:hypothetical protein